MRDDCKEAITSSNNLAELQIVAEKMFLQYRTALYLSRYTSW